MKRELIAKVGPYTIRTGRTPQYNREEGYWESSANIEREPEKDENGILQDMTIYGYIDHCNGSWEQAETMHGEMLLLAHTQP